MLFDLQQLHAVEVDNGVQAVYGVRVRVALGMLALPRRGVHDPATRRPIWQKAAERPGLEVNLASLGKTPIAQSAAELFARSSEVKCGIHLRDQHRGTRTGDEAARRNTRRCILDFEIQFEKLTRPLSPHRRPAAASVEIGYRILAWRLDQVDRDEEIRRHVVRVGPHDLR